MSGQLVLFYFSKTINGVFIKGHITVWVMAEAQNIGIQINKYKFSSFTCDFLF